VLLVVSGTGAAAQEASGRIEGVATIAARLTSPRQRVRVYRDPGGPPVRPAGEHPFSGVVVSLESTPALRGQARGPLRHAMRQRDERFLPHVLAVAAGATVDFPIHADMRGFVPVFDHSFYTVPDADGRFALAGVPAGDYELVLWHERIRPVRIPVRVTAGGVAEVRVALPVIEAPAEP
jgi:hypothetical protein